MKQRNSYLFIILCWLCTYGFPVQAQDTSLQAIEEAINSYNYRQAIDLIGRLDFSELPTATEKAGRLQGTEPV